MGNPATGTYGPFSAHIAIDQANPAAYVVRLMQSGLGMPDRDYYLATTRTWPPRARPTRSTWRTCSAIAGINDPQRAAAVFALESRMAQAHWSAAERRDADKTYNPMSLAQLAEMCVGIPCCFSAMCSTR